MTGAVIAVVSLFAVVAMECLSTGMPFNYMGSRVDVASQGAALQQLAGDVIESKTLADIVQRESAGFFIKPPGVGGAFKCGRVE